MWKNRQSLWNLIHNVSSLGNALQYMLKQIESYNRDCVGIQGLEMLFELECAHFNSTVLDLSYRMSKQTAFFYPIQVLLESLFFIDLI